MPSSSRSPWEERLRWVNSKTNREHQLTRASVAWLYIDKFDPRILSWSLPWSLTQSLSPNVGYQTKGKHPCQLSV